MDTDSRTVVGFGLRLASGITDTTVERSTWVCREVDGRKQWAELVMVRGGNTR